MSIIEKIILFIKNVLLKKQEIKAIEAHKVTIIQEKDNNFLESIKVNIPIQVKKKKIETLVCVGDGLGIHNKMSS